MKKLSTYLFLILFSFSAPSFADDISDFQIEGISVGDSLLDYMSEREIKSEIERNKDFYYYKSKDFVEVYNYKKREIYEYLSFIIKTDDRSFLIYGIYGNIDNNINECLKIKNDVVEELSLMFPKTNKRNSKFSPSFDPSGKSIIYLSNFSFDTKDEINVECYDYSEEHKDKRNVTNGLSVSILSYETFSWLEQS